MAFNTDEEIEDQESIIYVGNKKIKYVSSTLDIHIPPRTLMMRHNSSILELVMLIRSGMS